MKKDEHWTTEPLMGWGENKVGLLGLPLPDPEPGPWDVLLALLGADGPDARGADGGPAAELFREARALAAQGRGGDTVVGHLTAGEIVVPRSLQTPDVMAALKRAAAEQGVSLPVFQVGSRKNRINPRTGAPEFDEGDDEAPADDGQGEENMDASGGSAPESSDTPQTSTENVDSQPTPPPARGAPIKAYQQPGHDPLHDDVVYYYPDGSSEIRTGGSADWRTNNPGSVGAGPFAQKNGAIGRFTSTGRAIFTDPATGDTALRKLLNSNDYRALPLDDMISKFAGRKSANLPAYQAFMRDYVNVPGDTLATDMSPDQWNAVHDGIEQFENTTPGESLSGMLPRPQRFVP